MNNASKRDDGTLTRTVEFKATDEERRVAFGGVMVPDKVDLQGDWLTEDTVRDLSDGFMAGLGDGESVPGVMHSVFPEDHVTLVENTVLDEPREAGGREFPAGSWLQGWKFEDDGLWALVRDGVLSAYSIGAHDVKWSEASEQGDLPDHVEVAADYPDDGPVWQILSADVREVSSVDIPAVPDAVMVSAKAGGAKSILDQVGGKNEFVAVMEDRGATEDEGERLWHYLQRAAEESGKSPGVLRRAWDAVTGGGPGDGAAKEGRALSASNRNRLMAAHDALEDALSADLDFETNRFTDDSSVDFDVADYKAADDPGGTPDGEDDEEDKQMGDDNPDDAPEWAKSLTETVEENSVRIKELAEEREEEKGAWDDAPEWAKELAGKTDALDERVDELASASGKSQQLEGEAGGGDDSPTKADILGLAGGD